MARQSYDKKTLLNHLPRLPDHAGTLAEERMGVTLEAATQLNTKGGLTAVEVDNSRRLRKALRKHRLVKWGFSTDNARCTKALGNWEEYDE